MISVVRKGGDPILVLLTLALTTLPLYAVPTIELPKEISGEVGDLIGIKAKTTGKVVKWVVLDKGISVFPGELKDPYQTVISAKKKGTFRLLAYTSDETGPSEPAICTIKVKVAPIDPDDPDVPVPPKPPVPPPGPVDPLTTELQTIYNGLTETDKAESLLKLVALYEQVPASLSDPAIKNVGQMRAFLVKAFTSVLPVAKIKPIRDRLNTAMYPELPTNPGDPVNVAAVTATFQKYHKILQGVK